MKDVEGAVGAPITISEDKATVIVGRRVCALRMPSPSLHGIEGGILRPRGADDVPS